MTNAGEQKAEIKSLPYRDPSSKDLFSALVSTREKAGNQGKRDWIKEIQFIGGNRDKFGNLSNVC